MKVFKPRLSALLCPFLFSNCATNHKVTEKTPVVMVHGIFDTGKDFGVLTERLKEAGYKCLNPDLAPNTASNGIEPLAHQLDHYIEDNLDPDTHFHLLGYSMGGIIARTYLANAKNKQRVTSLTTLATPHHGTKLAKMYPVKGGKELRPNSDFLNTLNKNPDSFHSNTLSVRTKLDGIIIPSRSSILPDADNKTFTTPSHPSLLISKQVAQTVLKHLKKADTAIAN